MLSALIPIFGMCFALLLILGLATVLFLMVLTVSRRRERLAMRAIDKGETEVARAIVSRNPQWILWVFLGVVALAVVISLPWWGNLIVAIVGITTFQVWYPALVGRAPDGGNGKKKGDGLQAQFLIETGKPGERDASKPPAPPTPPVETPAAPNEHGESMQ